MLLKANKYRKDKKADCRQNELGSRIFVGRVFGDYAECLHFYPSFSYGRIIAGESRRERLVLTRNGNKDRRDRRTDSGCGKELRWLHRADHHPADHQRRRLNHRQCLL